MATRAIHCGRQLLLRRPYQPRLRWASTAAAAEKPAPTFYALFPNSLPHGPPPDGPYNLDARALRREFLKLQQLHHPDLAAASDTSSALINNAYRTLLDPLARAEYILNLKGLETAVEGEGDIGGEMLMEVMEVREEIEEASTPEALGQLKEKNEQRKKACEDELQQLFRDANWEEAKKIVVQLRYWYMVARSIEEKL
jgi:molecular chaperone HscB